MQHWESASIGKVSISSTELYSKSSSFGHNASNGSPSGCPNKVSIQPDGFPPTKYQSHIQGNQRNLKDLIRLTKFSMTKLMAKGSTRYNKQAFERIIINSKESAEGLEALDSSNLVRSKKNTSGKQSQKHYKNTTYQINHQINYSSSK